MNRDLGHAQVIGKGDAKALIKELFEEEALVIGGLAAVHDVDDDLVWRLMKNLDVIRAKAMRRLDDRDPEIPEGGPAIRAKLKPHPAIEDFLLNLRRV